jgi:hypothetical protein
MTVIEATGTRRLRWLLAGTMSILIVFVASVAFGILNQGADTSAAPPVVVEESRAPEPLPSDAAPPDAGPDVDLRALYSGCAAGDLSDCDSLYWASDIGSDYESFGASCGNRSEDLNGSCEAELPFPYTYGDDETLDALVDACDAEDWPACDDLYFSSESRSDYETWGATCGGRVDSVNGLCEETYS